MSSGAGAFLDTLHAYNRAHAHAQNHARSTDDKERIEEEKELEVLSEMRKLYAADASRLAAQEAARARDRALASARAGRPQSGEAAGAASQHIPRFYVQRTTSPAPVEPDPPAEGEGSGDPAAQQPPPPRSSLPTQLRRESRTRYLESRAEELLDDRELAMLWDSIQAQSVDVPTNVPSALAAAASSPGSGALNSPSSASSPLGSGGSGLGGGAGLDVEKRLSFDSFQRVSLTLPASKSARYFKPSLFFSFPEDELGRISSRALWRFVSKKIQLTRLRISLTCYDDVGYGYLREQDLENYVYDQLGSLPPLASVERDFYPYYVFTAVRKFIFALDQSRRGKLRIRDIVHSPVMLEFDALRFPHGHNSGVGGGGAGTGAGGGRSKKASWFSAAHTQEVYAIYLGLDANQNGMLSREEFKQYNGGNLTSIFIDGLFAEYRMYPSSAGDAPPGSNDVSTNGDASNELEMDYKTFLDFVLAMEYKQSASSISYFFKILDFNHQGYLDAKTIQYWFRAVSEKMGQLGHEQVNASVVASEIFDMVSPAVPGRLTLQDLIQSRCGHTVVSILIDVNGFWKYDNRENLMHTESENDDN